MPRLQVRNAGSYAAEIYVDETLLETETYKSSPELTIATSDLRVLDLTLEDLREAQLGELIFRQTDQLGAFDLTAVTFAPWGLMNSVLRHRGDKRPPLNGKVKPPICSIRLQIDPAEWGVFQA
jgi:hypothetical protein